MQKKVFTVILILVSVLAGVFFRFYPRWLPYFDIVAKQEVTQKQWRSLQKAVEEDYPDLSVAAVAKLTQATFDARSKDEQLVLTAQINDRARTLKNKYKDERGRVFLNGIDSYYFYRLLNNLLRYGDIGDREVNGVVYDNLAGNPIDQAPKNSAHIWLGFVTYKLATVFQKDIVLADVLFYIPIFLSVIIAVFSFLVARYLGANNIGAFFASIAINLSPFLLSRSVGEWFDTDIYNVLFPLLAFGTFLFSFGKMTQARRVLLTCFSGLFLAFYASTWKGWWFIFDIMIFSGVFFVLNEKMSQSEEGREDRVIRKHLFSVGLLFIFTSLFVVMLNSFSVWKDIILEPLRLCRILQVASSSWPNVYLTVAELSPVEPFQIALSLGGYFVFFGSMIGLIYIFLAERALRNARYGFGFLCLVVWIFSTFYTAIHALRFVLLLVVPIGLAFGVTISKLYEFVQQASLKYLKPGMALVAKVVVLCIFSSYLVFNTMSVHKTLLASVPQMNDTWYHVLTAIKNETPKNAIINSWWDFGHWFKGVAERRVLFDGMTQNTPYAYWVASVLLTDNEDQAIGILRMINTSGNKVADILEGEEGLDASKVVATIKEVAGKSKQEAKAYLQKFLSPERTDELLSYLFPKHLPPVYFVVSYDMPSKATTISYVGEWDFENVDLWFKKKKLSEFEFVLYAQKKYGLAQADARKKYMTMAFLDETEAKRWFSHPWHYHSDMATGYRDGKMRIFDNGLVVDVENHHAFVVSEFSEKRGVPKSLFFMENGIMKEVAQKDATLNYSALLIQRENKDQGILLDAGLAKCMLARLYYFGGEGLKYFKLYKKQDDDKGNVIYVYQVLWPKEG